MKHHPLLPEHEELRRAFAWLIEQETIDAKRIEEAAVRFDLSPADEAFLIEQFLHHAGSDEPHRP